MVLLYLTAESAEIDTIVIIKTWPWVAKVSIQETINYRNRLVDCVGFNITFNTEKAYMLQILVFPFLTKCEFM